MRQILCDLCEQPIEGDLPEYDRKACVTLSDGSDMHYVLRADPIKLHMHPTCWIAHRDVYLTERRKDEERLLRASRTRQPGPPWWERLIDKLLDLLAGK